MKPGSKQKFYMKFTFVQSNGIILYILYMQIWNIFQYVTFINMFIFSLVVVGEFDCLQPRKRNILTAIFDTKQNNVEAKGNVAFFFFGLNKTSVCMTGICAKFPFK